MGDERYRSGMATGGGGFNSAAAGLKRYGGGRSVPNLGPVRDKLGYAKRDAAEKARRNLTLKRMKMDPRSPAPGQGLNFKVM